ncbi:unnamed protein product [Phyllotreta striolata]|uniref:C2H2-type domain-containing protein n=1 Tax=Phyllotreta striolata TaxID=444603 RepID=A0A9N9XN87_PHYSR|nr:unnamed protein product [Phyllotreta striolata]
MNVILFCCSRKMSAKTAEWTNSECEDLSPLRCLECNVNFTTETFLYSHLFHHIKQPFIAVEKLQLPPLKITIKNTSGNKFEIINCQSPKEYTGSPEAQGQAEEGGKRGDNRSEVLENFLGDPETTDSNLAVHKEGLEGNFHSPSEKDSPDIQPEYSNIDDIIQGSPSTGDGASQSFDKGADANSNSESGASDYGSIPGAEPTPPPEPSVEYPKIRIKTTGLLKEPSSLTITEITDDNPEEDSSHRQTQDDSNLWSSSNMDDPMKMQNTDDSNILSLFNNNERAKDLGFHSSDSEFISLDRLEDRNRGAMQVYNSNQNPSTTLDNLTGLPMQALAQQVSRLHQSSAGMHQQNVLINIQQFPSGPPPQPTYQAPPMYPYPQQPMHHPYQYQQQYRPPPYYPPGHPVPPVPPGYPPQHMPPPPQMNQQPPQMHPSVSQPQNMQQPGAAYRQPMPPRQMAPRQPVQGNRMPNGPRQPVVQRQPIARPRAPMVRPRGAMGMTAVRSVRPRMGVPQNGIRPQAVVKRSPEQMQQLQAKKKRFDLLTPDKDDEDCQVICMQPKNTDGGLPQIESVQGGTCDSAESSIMHLSDSITLSVRNPVPKPVEQPKKSDAKAVANILATRGITVTATAKPKEKEPVHKTNPSITSSLNLNGAVSIIPAAKSNGNTTKNASQDSLPTVDLTEDAPGQHQSLNSPQKPQRQGLPFRCDLCPAQYPNSAGLMKHRQTYHKTTNTVADLGIPVINLKTAGVMQRMAAMGITNYIPLPSQGADGTFVVPVINSRNPPNLANIGATTMITLGPIRSIPRPLNNLKPVNHVPK